MERKAYVEVYSTFIATDIAFIKSLFDANNISYFIGGENFLQVRPLVVPAKIIVEESQMEIAKELLKEFKSGHFGGSMES